MDENYRHCEALVRAADKDRFLATLFAPADKRGPLFALYAFNAEIASVRDRAREPMPGEIRLQWWRDVINGERTGEAAANPIAAALIDTVARFSLPKPRLLDLIEAHAFDLYDDPMPTFDALEGYIRHTSATVFDLAGANLRRTCRAGERAGRHGVRHHGVVAFLRAPCVAAAAVRSRSKRWIETRRRLRSSQARRHLVWSLRLASSAIGRAKAWQPSKHCCRNCRSQPCRHSCRSPLCRVTSRRWSGPVTSRSGLPWRFRSGGGSGRCGGRRSEWSRVMRR